MNSQTMAALNRAYEVFAGYKDSHGFAKKSGVSHSLRELTSEDWSAMDERFDMGVQIYSDQTPNLLRHFLPRFLEWMSVFEMWDLAYRLNHCRWLDWPTV